MLIYEKKVEENNELVRHLFYAEGNIPTSDDVQLSYKDDEGAAVSDLTVTSKLLDDGHGGIKTEDGEAINVWAGNVNIIPGNLDGEDIEPEPEPEPEKPTCVSIEVVDSPTKTEYTVGEQLNLTGLRIIGTYDNDDGEELGVNEFTTSPYTNGDTLDTAGEITITINGAASTDFEGLTTSFNIVVNAETQEEPGE